MILDDGMVDRQAGEWDELALRHGSPFHASWFLRAIARAWPGTREARHVLVRGADGAALAPAYLYRSCPRLDYYRPATSPPLAAPILMSHALVGWYGGVAGTGESARAAVVEELLVEAGRSRAIALVAGVDARDDAQVALLHRFGFSVERWHTLMVRGLAGLPADPTDALTQRQRSRVRNTLSQARRAGTGVRTSRLDDVETIVELVTGRSRHQPFDDDLLPAELLRTVLTGGGPAVDAMLAVDSAGRPIGVHVSLCWGRRYVMWVGGHDAGTLDRNRQSHVLYEACVVRARSLGFDEVQAGRAMYPVKRQHGFGPVALLAAVRGSTEDQHREAVAWLEALGARHRDKYGSELAAMPTAPGSTWS
jgi:hypothetical protein